VATIQLNILVILLHRQGKLESPFSRETRHVYWCRI